VASKVVCVRLHSVLCFMQLLKCDIELTLLSEPNQHLVVTVLYVCLGDVA
jgi:hypothetical protein